MLPPVSLIPGGKFAADVDDTGSHLAAGVSPVLERSQTHIHDNITLMYMEDKGLGTNVAAHFLVVLPDITVQMGVSTEMCG